MSNLKQEIHSLEAQIVRYWMLETGLKEFQTLNSRLQGRLRLTKTSLFRKTR